MVFDHDFEQEKHYHPENFERGGEQTPDVDTENDLNAELDHELTEEDVLIDLANKEQKERQSKQKRRLTPDERMEQIEDQKFRWGEPRQK